MLQTSQHHRGLEVTARHAVLAAGACLLWGCNHLLGLDAIVLQHSGKGTTSGTEAGGDGAVGGGGSVAAGGYAGAGAAEPAGAGGSGAAVDQGGSGGAPVTCSYPAGPYGVNQGHTLSSSLSWQGYRAQSDAVATVSVQDYFDCDGSRGIDAVLFTTEQWYCSACQMEAQDLANLAPQWASLGIQVVVLLITGPNDEPATPDDAWQWKTVNGLASVTVLADPNWLLTPGSSVGTPLETVVDPRTMTVTYLQEGYYGDFPELLALAQQNGG
jgi:hypothetical protein